VTQRPWSLRWGILLVAIPLAAAVAVPPAGAGNVTPLLPDLVTLPITDPMIAHDRQTRRLELRFSNRVANIGAGPMELRGVLDPDTNTTIAYQRIYRSDGSTTDREAGRFVFDGHHDHWHFDDFASYELRRSKASGTVGEMVAGSTKVTFCLMDSERVPDFVGGPEAPQFFCSPEVQGISVGWMDIYFRLLPGQSISLAGVKSGTYWLVSRADPSGRIAELRTDNNVAAVRIRIRKDQRRVKILK